MRQEVPTMFRFGLIVQRDQVGVIGFTESFGIVWQVRLCGPVVAVDRFADMVTAGLGKPQDPGVRASGVSVPYRLCFLKHGLFPSSNVVDNIRKDDRGGNE